ncbi:hypothetical protein K501DRAFT_326645 [Backusella circina FSU 941]|nr:hypothetical protein K501DRAFT_326645 [Backusella circina FSU 941]
MNRTGEKSKSRNTKESIEDYLLDEACTRDTCLIALGGGVIGDLVGYVASTFMRGIPFVQIPTTLLSMVDSSIGGKTAVDTPHGKNLIGTFWQPRRIFIDLCMLATLPKREIANGMAEIIKTAAISSEPEFAKLETGKSKIEAAILNANQPLSSDTNREFLASVIGASVRFKADVVTLDEREVGIRGLLNFGHSIGHAIEALLSPHWLHGECISLGLVMETEIARLLSYCSQDTVDRIRRCLKLYNLPVEFDEKIRDKVKLKELMKALKIDKKNIGAQKRMVLLKKIGETVEPCASHVDDADIEEILLEHIFTCSAHYSIASPEKTSFGKISLPPLRLIVPSSNDLDEKVFQLDRMISEKFDCSVRFEYSSNVNAGWIQQQEQRAKKGITIFFTTEAGSSMLPGMSEQSSWFEFVVLPHEGITSFCKNALLFIETVTGVQKRHIDPSLDKATSFVTPTVLNYESVIPVVLNQWLEKADAVEYRVDLLENGNNRWVYNAGTQLAYLRRITQLPIVYTVRTSPQAGKFDPTWIKLYEELILWGHRWGCDYVDVEIKTLSVEDLDTVMRTNQRLYPTTKIIASFHDPEHKYPWFSTNMKEIYDQANQLLEKHNHQGVIKLVGYANSFWDNIELEQFRHSLDPDNKRQFIFINMGPHGRLSRVINRFLSPATHASMPASAAPGQLSISELIHIRNELALD